MGTNPIYKFLQSLPTNGWTTAIGGICAILYGLGGIGSGQLELEVGIGFIIGGWTALGLGSKLEKMKKTE